MRAKTLIMIGMVVGSFVGGWVPSLWGASGLSYASVLFSMIGSVLGIWGGFRLSRI